MNISEYDLTGKVVFVTGAGRGIGKGIAQVLAEAGADVIINALTSRYVEGLAADIGKATGRRVVPLVADVTKADEVERAIARIVGEFGALHILVNNLGDAIRKPLVQLTDEELRTVLDLNFTATVLCSRAAGPHMLARRSGKVINITSFAAVKGAPNLTIYAAAKAALVGFTRALALEWAPYGVQVNGIGPGLFPDPVTVGDAAYRQRVEDAKRTVPLGREGRLREVGLLALYLASSASDYMTGQTIYLDGGLTL
ncbi:MAG: short-chain dehydrogenase/reductase SDR [Candidatus Rokubacteria bacterium CSP1-6]|nr:MAG: short-chain dehydrogenase/reductase SDR [Candidatus Rokubacteria bacterium CSP1-6]